MYIFIFMCSILCSLSFQMDEETFNQGNGICFICRFTTLPHEDAFWHGACFHVECLNNLETGWMETIEPSPYPLYIWLFNHWNGTVQYVLINGILCLDWPYHWPLGDPTVEILDDTDWAEVPGWNAEWDADPEWEAAEAEYEERDVIDLASGVEGEEEELLGVSDDEEQNKENIYPNRVDGETETEDA